MECYEWCTGVVYGCNLDATIHITIAYDMHMYMYMYKYMHMYI